MQNAEKGSTPRKGILGRLESWVDLRTGVNSLMHESLDEPIPGGASLAYVFGSGLLFIFISQVITGLCLALYYVPSAESAHTSVAYITKQVAAGQFLRSLHYYGSSAMIIVLVLHFLQTFIYGSFKGRRELLWISGAVLSLLVLGMGFTGYLLPWDQSAYFATAVGTNIVGEVPFIGQWLTDMLRGGNTLGTLTISRFYFAHVFLIPGLIFLLIGLHIVLFRKAGAAGPIKADPISPKLPTETFYPHQVVLDMAFALLIMVGLGFLAYFHPVQLGPIADPSNTKFVPRPEWYYLPMFEWLKFWSSRMEVFAVVLIPGILALAFFLMPFLDRKLERRPWRRPIPMLAVAIVLVGIVFLGFKSHLDDLHDHSVAVQLAYQQKEAEQYTKAPFTARMESESGVPVSSEPVNPLIAQGKSIFASKGCSGCHGTNGTGTATAPSLVGITAKYPLPQITSLLQHPNAKMRAGHMPSFDLAAPDMAALFSYLQSLGKPGQAAPAAAPAAASAPALAAGSAPAPSTGTAGAPPSGSAPPPAAASKNVASDRSGELIFKQRGCAACHGAAGAGGRAPALQPLIARKSNASVLKLLHAPNAKMKAGGMPPVTGSPAELNSLVAYLRTLGGAKGGKQGAPAKQLADKDAATSSGAASSSAPTAPHTSASTGTTPSPAPASTAATSSTAGSAAPSSKPHPGHAIFVSQGCAACHGANAGGTHFAPALVGISAKFPGAALPHLLHNPNAKMKAGGMPPVTANATDLKKLLSYLTSLDVAPAAAPAATATAAGGQPAAPPAPGAKGSPPPDAKAAANVPLSPLALRGQHVFEHYSCETCHGAGGLHGTAAAPGLAGTASILPRSTLENLMRHHSIQMRNGNMPQTSMSAGDLKALTTFIRTMPAGTDAPQ